MKVVHIAILCLVAPVFMGCSHGHTRGTVVFKDSEKEGHICIGHDEAKIGDLVKVFKSSCSSVLIDNGDKGVRNKISCEKTFLGEGKIIEFSGEHFAKIQALGDLNLEQGLVVEKVKM